MDLRAPHSGGAQQRPRPQRAVSGGSYGSSTLPKQSSLLSRLSTVRSVTQPAPVVDLTGDGVKSERRNEVAFLGNREALVGSPDIIKIEDEDEEPPAKRLKTSADSSRSQKDSSTGDGTDRAHEIGFGTPLPNLPSTKPTVKRVSGTRRQRMGIELSSRKARGLDPPDAAVRATLPTRNALDFSPWTGKAGAHAEDTLNDTVIKAGFYDKPQGANHNESNSAKASIWPNLSQKNHHGLSMLGYLFTAAMEKRQASGRCTAPSTFKPPPRVTVTDTKRETWLRDLANPDIPLRKQSRTIPHGIRGKLLMEQCLSKDIPLQRAIWLAKCVGANELRAFRRKGVSGSAAASGEVKWVREWTVSVEQFLDSVIATCGKQEEWQKQASYAVKLVTAIYAEKLLDVGHFLDWIVSSLADATLTTLPIWTTIAQVFWKGIISRSRRGRRFARSVLEHLQQIKESKGAVNAALQFRQEQLVRVLAASNRACLIIPQVWEQYKALLSPKPGPEDTAAKNIAKRNERLAAPLYKSAANMRSPVLDLYTMLDSLGLDADHSALSAKCLALIPDASSLIHALLDWASTPYRAGVARIYYASNAIAQLHHAGYDTDASILQYLSNADHISEQASKSIHGIIVDLVRLEAFSIGRYLQWLITSGASGSSGRPTCASSLIAALPMTGLPLHVVNLRKTLMRRLGYQVDEQRAVDNALAQIDAALFENTSWRFDPSMLAEDLTTSVKLSIARFAYAKTVANMKDFGTSLASFILARDILEWVGDLPSLTSLVSASTSTSDSMLLATACDTVNLHAEAFAALGQFKPLVDGLSGQYMMLRSQQPTDRSFIHALSSLAQRVHDKAALVKLLADDLTISEQQSSLAVCSPASDSLIGMHASSLDSDDDIDAVFASGNTMDEQLMQRVFMRIMQRAAKPPTPGLESTSRVVGWLNQLRSVDGGSGSFENIVHGYLRSLFDGSQGSSFSASAVSNLAVSDSVPLTAVGDFAKETDAPELANTVLKMFISDDNLEFGLNECERYRFRLLQDQCQANDSDSLVTLVRTACDSPEFEPEDPDLIRFIIRCISNRPGSVRKVFVDGGDHSKLLRCNASRIITRVLQLGQGNSDTTALTKEFDIKSLVRMANAFSVRYCLEAMRYLKAKATWSQDDEHVLEQAILESFTDHSDVWAQLLEFAGESTNRAIHEWARDQLFNMASDKSGLEDNSAHEHLQRCLELLAITSRAANKGEDTAAVNVLTDKLKDIEVKLSELSETDSESKHEFSDLLEQLQIMLHLSVVHVHAVVNEGDASKHARTQLLGTLCSLLVHQKLQLYPETMEYLFDLSSTLADNLAENAETAVKVPPNLRLPPDQRLTFLLGTDADAAETWLALASQDRLQGSQQQRALAKHASQHPISGRPMGLSSSQQQSPTQPQHSRWPSSSQPSLMRQDSRIMPEIKTQPYQPRKWEIFSDPTPVMGENDGSLSLGLFGARKV